MRPRDARGMTSARMTTRFTIRHTFDIDLEGYWRDVFFDPEYNRRLYTEALAFKRYELVDQATHADGSVTRTARFEPPFEVPGPAQRVLGPSLGYTELGRFDPAQKRWSYTITPRVLPDKMTSRGTFWVEPRGTDRVERFAEVEVSVKILGLGTLLEAFIERVTRESYDKAGAFTQLFLRERAAKPRP